jgi:hypothetical protein
MRRASVTLLLAMTALVACGPDETAASGEITGQVLAGPTCPVEMVGSRWPPAPWEGTVRATAADGSAHETTTDADGTYTLTLPPGTYEVTAVTPDGASPTATPVEVTVAAGLPQRVDLQVDTGIR